MNDAALSRWLINSLLTDSQLDVIPPDGGVSLRFRGQDMKAPHENDKVIVMDDDGDHDAVVHTVLSVQFMVRMPDGRDKFLLFKYEGIDWRHKT
ncbi:hypothetical protein LCGC14_2843620 [marine sediment metagenome]|uniref:Uncharacterized protein n=1 Tax=marine sediment metagenome TaxID=412755 RepID=A0A0F8YAM7_9ZZZZ